MQEETSFEEQLPIEIFGDRPASTRSHHQPDDGRRPGIHEIQPARGQKCAGGFHHPRERLEETPGGSGRFRHDRGHRVDGALPRFSEVDVSGHVVELSLSIGHIYIFCCVKFEHIFAYVTKLNKPPQNRNI